MSAFGCGQCKKCSRPLGPVGRCMTCLAEAHMSKNPQNATRRKNVSKRSNMTDDYEKRGVAVTLELRSGSATTERYADIISRALRAAAADEREACARICDEHEKRNLTLVSFGNYEPDIYQQRASAADALADAIRARGGA